MIMYGYVSLCMVMYDYPTVMMVTFLTGTDDVLSETVRDGILYLEDEFDKVWVGTLFLFYLWIEWYTLKLHIRRTKC